MEKPNSLEMDVLQCILSPRKQEHPSLYNQIAHLRVKSREFTGVGAYINFQLTEEGEKNLDETFREGMLSAAKIVELDTLPSGLGFVLDITDGRINYLELFSYGNEKWDGSFQNYRLVDS